MPIANPALPVRRLLLAEVAERCRVSTRTVKQWIRDGALPAIDTSSKIGSKKPRLVVDLVELERFEEARSTVPPPKPATRRMRDDAIPNYFAGLGGAK